MTKKATEMKVQVEVDTEVLKMLLDKLSNLECRVAQLEAQVSGMDQAITLDSTVMTDALRPGGLLYERMKG